jgi:thioredoxin-dependent peroxiredoxin
MVPSIRSLGFSRCRAVLATVALAFVASSGARAQQPAATPAAPAAPTPAVGDMAPDFVVPSATRYGLLRPPIKLSDLRGQTVVLAFFFKARTKG